MERQLDIFKFRSAWEGLSSVLSAASLVIQVFSQSTVFVTVLYQQPTMLLYVLANLLPVLMPPSRYDSLFDTSKFLQPSYNGKLTNRPSVGCYLS
jgi:hypothetical protein